MTMIESPAGNFTAEPNFAATATGEPALSWVEKSGDTLSILKLSFYRNNSWAAPLTVASGPDWFVNWADFPAVAIDKDNRILASWLQKSDTATFAYDVRLSLSTDGGKRWGKSFVPHKDSTNTEHGFVSMAPKPTGGFAVTWLDGRETTSDSGAMTVRAATVTPDGTLQDEALLDDRTCDCCQTSMTALSDGSLLVSYRNRSAEEIRDNYIVKGAGKQWSAPKPIASDNWKIAGCPVNGPSLASNQALVVASWFTMGPDNKPKVFAAYSRDFGETFQEPVRLDSGDPLGRVDVIMYDSRIALVSWLEVVDDKAQIFVRAIQPEGIISAPMTVTESSSSRASGFARMAPFEGGALIAWTNAADTSTVRTAVITFQK